MAKIMLLDSKKNFYKANMHCHSTLSDGRFTPHELKEYYKSHGYSILAITDHEQVSSHAYLDDEQFLTVTSSELAIKEFPAESTLKNFNMKVCHLNIYAKEQSNEKTVCYNSVLDHYTSGKRREELLKHFRTIKAIAAAPLEELEKVVPKNTAQSVYQYFHTERK